MGQCAQHLRAAVHFQYFVTDIPNDTGTRLDFKQIRAENATFDLAIDHQVIAAYLAFHTSVLGNDEITGMSCLRDNIANDLAVNAHPAAEQQITLHAGGGADQAVHIDHVRLSAGGVGGNS